MFKRKLVELKLASIPMFAQCSPAQIVALSRLATEVQVAAGTDLTRQGEPGLEFFVIVEGTAQVLKNGEPVAMLGDGDYFGEISLLADITRTAQVTSTTPMRLAVISAAEFWAAVDEVPALAHAIMRGLAHRINGLEQQLFVPSLSLVDRTVVDRMELS